MFPKSQLKNADGKQAMLMKSAQKQLMLLTGMISHYYVFLLVVILWEGKCYMLSALEKCHLNELLIIESQGLAVSNIGIKIKEQ